MSLRHEQRVNIDGIPCGGTCEGIGVTITWHDGTQADKSQNGAFIEDVLGACLERLEFYQQTKFACDYNLRAIEAVRLALAEIRERIAVRKQRGVYGTEQV